MSINNADSEEGLNIGKLSGAPGALVGGAALGAGVLIPFMLGASFCLITGAVLLVGVKALSKSTM